MRRLDWIDYCAIAIALAGIFWGFVCLSEKNAAHPKIATRVTQTSDATWHVDCGPNLNCDFAHSRVTP